MKSRPTLALSLAACLLFAGTAFAATSQPVRVVELFTSQGCSSCPPANRFVSKLAEQGADTLTLSYGVTYWDYLGWTDTFGDPAFTERQRHYRDALDTNMYTPQIVVNGAQDAPRWKRSQVEAHSLPSDVTLRESGGSLIVEGEVAAGATLALVAYTPGEQTVAVKRGENHGRTLTLTNVVTGIEYATWNGEPLTLDRPDTALAVLVHDPADGSVIAAANYIP